MMEGVIGRPEELVINRGTRLWKDTGNIASALGYLAVFWSTVVLLGGFVGNVLLKEFWVLTALSFLMSFKMIDIGINELGKNFYMEESNIIIDILHRQKRTEELKCRAILVMLCPVHVVKCVLFYLLFLLFLVSPVVNLGVSVWRLVRRDYGDAGGDILNRAKLMAALDIFYALILLQSLFAFYFLAIDCYLGYSIRSMNKHTGLFEEWGSKVIVMYQHETERKLKEDRELPGNWNLIAYGVELLRSASGDDHLWGARILDKFFDKDTSAREELLSSRLSIKNLIGMIGQRGTDKIENRERAARIVAHLACDLHITPFPGTLQCLYSLLESCKPQVIRLSENLDTKDQHGSLETPDHQDDYDRMSMPDKTDHRHEQGISSLRIWSVKKATTMLDKLVKKRDEMMGPPNPYSHPYESIGTKELISHGLMILEGLTQDQVNCTEIIKHQLLLSKVTSPLRRHDFLSNLRDCRMVEILSISLIVVSRLLGSLRGGATSLRQELVSNKETVSNLMGILETDSKGAQKLHEQAIEILTELALDASFQKVDFNKLFDTLLCIFLDEEASNTIAEQADKHKATKLRVKAGEALTSLLPVCSASDANVADILLEQGASNLLTKVFNQIVKSSKMGTTAVEAKGDSASNENQSEEEKCLAAMLSLAVVICNENAINKEDFVHASREDDAALVKKLKEVLEANKRRSAECLRIVKLTCQVVIAMTKVKPSCIQQFTEHNFTEALTEALETMWEVDDCMLFAANDHHEMIKPTRSLASLVKEAQELLLQTA